MDIVHPVILFDQFASYHDYAPALDRAVRQAETWWEQQGQYVHFATVKVLGPDHAINLSLGNPWGQAWDALINQNLLGLPSADVGAHKFLVLLRGWDHAQYVGWGGGQLAVVGDYCLKYLASVGGPDAIVDDNLAVGVMCHEVGHTLGYDHTNTGIMSLGWSQYPNVLLEQAAMLPASGPGPTTLPQPCLRPD